MKWIASLSFLTLSVCSYCQLVSGRLLEDERRLLTKTDFTIQDANEGVLFYELSVTNKGTVASARLVTNGTTITSTPTRIKVKNELMKYTFNPGLYYPEFHTVLVKITTQNFAQK
jgi:hypothetical protein